MSSCRRFSGTCTCHPPATVLDYAQCRPPTTAGTVHAVLSPMLKHEQVVIVPLFWKCACRPVAAFLEHARAILLPLLWTMHMSSSCHYWNNTCRALTTVGTCTGHSPVTFLEMHMSFSRRFSATCTCRPPATCSESYMSSSYRCWNIHVLSSCHCSGPCACRPLATVLEMRMSPCRPFSATCTCRRPATVLD